MNQYMAPSRKGRASFFMLYFYIYAHMPEIRRWKTKEEMQASDKDPVRVVKRSQRAMLRGSREMRRLGEQSLVPPSAHPDMLYELTPAELKQRYPKRYEMFTRMSAAMRNETMHPDHRNQEHELPSEQERILMLKWLRMVNGLDTLVARYDSMDEVVNADGVPVFADAQTQELHVSDPINFDTALVPPVLELRPPQAEAAQAALQALEQGHMSGYFELPTGFGKTVLFIKMLEAMRGRGLIVVPTKDLVRQTQEKLRKYVPHLDTKIIMSGARVAEEGEGQDITIITYESFRLRVESGQLNANGYDMVVLDEVHEGLSENRSAAVDKFIEHSIAMGFSATPGFSEKKHAHDLLKHRFYGMTLEESISKGMNCDYKNTAVRVPDVDLASVRLKSTGDYDERDLERVVNFRQRDAYAVALWQQYFPGKPTYAYCESISRARATAMEFNSTLVAESGFEPPLIQNPDVPGDMIIDYDRDPTMEQLKAVEAGTLQLVAVPYHSEMPQAMQDLIWKLYKKGKIPVLTNVNKCITGNDHPPAEVCLNLRPMRSEVAIPQRGGRVLRVFKDKFAHIIDFIYEDSRRGRGKTFDEVANPQRFSGEENIHNLDAVLKGDTERDSIEELFDDVSDAVGQTESTTDDAPTILEGQVEPDTVEVEAIDGLTPVMTNESARLPFISPPQEFLLGPEGEAQRDYIIESCEHIIFADMLMHDAEFVRVLRSTPGFKDKGGLEYTLLDMTQLAVLATGIYERYASYHPDYSLLQSDYISIKTLLRSMEDRLLSVFTVAQKYNVRVPDDILDTIYGISPATRSRAS